MKYLLSLSLLGWSLAAFAAAPFPDGTPVGEWFARTDFPAPAGRRFVVTDYGVTKDSTVVQTAALQAVIDSAAVQGGVVVVPEGTFLSGALFFRPGTRLRIERGGVLKGSDDISDFPIVPTRIEGRSVLYFAALVNADSVDGFTVSGEGTIDGNGERYWRSFWLRRKVDPECTNMDELRPRLVYVSRSRNVRLDGVTLRNSPFWTTHLYRVDSARLTGLRILAPYHPVAAPSSDAVDLDACSCVHIEGCYMSVNDDAIALKGGKGPWADSDPDNGSNRHILIENCVFGYCHSCLTCGSEAIHNRNVVLRRCRVERADRLLWLKMRPDTPQNYEHILVEDISGSARSFLFVKPWTQFFDLQGRPDVPMSYASFLTMRNIDFECDTFFDVEFADEQYRLSDFRFENLRISARDTSCRRNAVPRFEWKNVRLRKVK